MTQAIPFADDEWNHKAYNAAVDYSILMAYDQHWGNKEAGPVAAQSWFEETLVKRMSGSRFGQDHRRDWELWVRLEQHRGRKAETVTFQQALITLAESETEPSFDPASKNLFFEYDEEDGSHHKVWFLDAVTAYNQMRAASGYKPAGYAIWRLGSRRPARSGRSSVQIKMRLPTVLRQINYRIPKSTSKAMVNF